MILPFLTAAEIAANAPRVASHLRAGGLIAYPTETVYGLGCALLPAALDRLRALKGRSDLKPFLLLIESADAARDLDWTAHARVLADVFWPGPLTLALRAGKDAYPDAVRAPNGTVAVRVSPHPAVRALVHANGGPLTSTSANVPGDAAAASAQDAARALERLGSPDEVWLLDGGTLPRSAPSTVVDCSAETARIVRAGAIAEADILARLEGTE